MPKREGDADTTPSANKIARTDSGDFSGAVKKRLSGATRTGQACDRCKASFLAATFEQRALTAATGTQDPMRCADRRLLSLRGQQH